MLNIRHERIASIARCHVTPPLPSWTRLWSTLYPVGTVVEDAPTSGYEKPEPFCFEMNRRISSSEGAVRLNKAMVTHSLSRNAHFVDSWKLVVHANKTVCQITNVA